MFPVTQLGHMVSLGPFRVQALKEYLVSHSWGPSGPERNNLGLWKDGQEALGISIEAYHLRIVLRIDVAKFGQDGTKRAASAWVLASLGAWVNLEGFPKEISI